MKKLILTFVFALTTIIGFAQNSGTNITVTIDNIKNDNGKVLISLHTTDTFMKGKGLMNAQSEIKDGKITVTFKDVEPGEYALLAVHDENENKRMDFRDNGMPLESYGASNNVMNFGPPQFEDAKFTTADKNLEMNIRF
ncbi:DUF2141 domain-containing protein [Winogradskyella vidalii]|uniref:DUF2141 domain-containing protein n=1 Tax=Winogradskyella vidalii TaxID=2615024 RepID=UPI0015C9534F|nr:DUF2141 domain-containing protein [Winogradskyella vidalii]